MLAVRLAVVVVSLVVLPEISLAVNYGEESSRCETLMRLQPGICANTVYNSTVRPNRFGHQSQAESYQELLQYKPLFNVNCSPYFQQFICTLYLPPCVADPLKTGETTLMQPCFELCQLARRNCEQLLVSFGVPWPKPLDCSDLPRQMPGSLLSAESSASSMNGGVSSSEVVSLCIPPIEIPSAEGGDGSFDHINGTTGDDKIGQKCPDSSMGAKSGMDYRLVVPANGHREQNQVADCGLTCSSIARLYTTPDQMTTIRLSVLGIALLTCASTLFTLLTFFMDIRRFRYPERPIIYMSMCYLVISIVHIVSFSLGESSSVACTSFDVVDSSSAATSPRPVEPMQLNTLITQGTRNEGCTVLFIFQYFFTMAASIWWVVLALAWFLAAGLKWGHEAIEGVAHFFHVVAWALPVIGTIVILALGLVEGDPVSGLCRVAVFSSPMAPTLARALYITPQLVCLSLGGFLLLAGFASLFRIRTVMKADGARTDRLERLMARIGILGLLFTIPSAVAAAASLFQLANKDAYMRIFFDQKCYSSNNGEVAVCPSPVTAGPLRPDFTVLLLENLCSVGVGLSTAFWVWSRKTVNAWTRCLCCACCSSSDSPGRAATAPMSPSALNGMPGGFAGSSSTTAAPGAPLLSHGRYSGSGLPPMSGMGGGMYNPHQQPLLSNMGQAHQYISS